MAHEGATGTASIILPTYNEAENVVPLIENLLKHLKEPVEIIIVDDDSPDHTAEIVQWHIDKHPGIPVRVERRMKNHGLRESIGRGFEIAKGDILCWMDCDFSHPAATMAELVERVRGGCPIAVASRYIDGGDYKRGIGWFGADESALAVLLSRVINWFIHIALDRRFHDYTSGFAAFRRSVLEPLLPLRGHYGEYFVDLMYRAIRSGSTFCEIPFISPPRRAGVTKTGTTFRQLFRHGLRYVKTIWRLWKEYHWFT